MPPRPQTDPSASPVADGQPSAGAGDGNGERRLIPGEATPSMAQYLEIKAANPDSLLWYRMGDFYELFFEDAVVASQALSITLTKRGKHLGEDIPMCGVPVVRADEYLQRLIRQGFRVAVCEQLEDTAEARKRGAKAVVRRDVVRLVTPGTLTEDALLDARTRNYLTALHVAPQGSDAMALASLDISTGELELGAVSARDLPGELARLQPSEIITGDAALADTRVKSWIEAAGAAATPVPAATFDSMAGERALKARLGVADLAAFGAFSRPELAAAGALLKYVELTQIGRQPVIRPPRSTGPESAMVIDAATRASLEIVRGASGGRQGSLLTAIDRTVTGPGARELASRLASPLRDPQAIAARLDALSCLLGRDRLREDVRGALRGAPDIARAISRLAFQRGGPADLAAVRDGIAAASALSDLLGRSGDGIGLPEELASIRTRLATAATRGLAQSLAAALVDSPPAHRRDGGFVREGFRADLDDARRLKDDSRKVMAALETRYAGETGIKSLKIRHNNVLGYYVEVGAANARPLTAEPLSETFRHRQTLANAMRFTTRELIETEGSIASAAERALAIEQEVFAELARRIGEQERALGGTAAALAELDHYAGLAELAFEEGYVRPEVTAGLELEIRGGRHPVVEQALRKAKMAPFIENDCVLGAAGSLTPGFDDEDGSGRIWLVTGPNMAGKSTFLRQTALIALLAQVGSFVPARAARIGVIDRLFSRVGAADDLARGRSTFMVEMVETAAILNQASERSLVILDEIGRGTATFDGLSIAWATVEYLHDVSRCRALFATHYHELTALAGRLPDLATVTMDVKEWQDEIVFLHKVRPGAADRSYGIQVAKLAGLPQTVVKRAREVLARLEKADRRSAGATGSLTDLPLFAYEPAAAGRDAPSELETAVDKIKPDELSPRAALEALYELKSLRRGEPGRQ
ncbi:MAG: DNA mismatch repair protein MutS [Hyphomicrobiaceae bacterium]|nr:DNA mismatch repair protein MutS [Hyphomicrobiaceae bacterium]